MPIVVEGNSNFIDRISSTRRLVAIGLVQSSDLTDSDIQDDAFLGHANRYIAKRIPNWANITDSDKRADLEVLVTKVAAVELLKVSPRYTQFDASSISDRQIYLGIKETIESYIEDIEKGINELNPTATGTSIPYFEVIDISEEETYQ